MHFANKWGGAVVFFSLLIGGQFLATFLYVTGFRFQPIFQIPQNSSNLLSLQMALGIVFCRSLE